MEIVRSSLYSPLSDTITGCAVLIPILGAWRSMQVNDNSYSMCTAKNNQLKIYVQN